MLLHMATLMRAGHVKVEDTKGRNWGIHSTVIQKSDTLATSSIFKGQETE